MGTEVVMSNFIDNANMTKYASRVKEYYGTDAMNDLLKLNGCKTVEELEAKVRSGEKIFEPKASSWNRKIQARYDKEKEVREGKLNTGDVRGCFTAGSGLDVDYLNMEYVPDRYSGFINLSTSGLGLNADYWNKEGVSDYFSTGNSGYVANEHDVTMNFLDMSRIYENAGNGMLLGSSEFDAYYLEYMKTHPVQNTVEESSGISMALNYAKSAYNTTTGYISEGLNSVRNGFNSAWSWWISDSSYSAITVDGEQIKNIHPDGIHDEKDIYVNQLSLGSIAKETACTLSVWWMIGAQHAKGVITPLDEAFNKVPNGKGGVDKTTGFVYEGGESGMAEAAGGQPLDVTTYHINDGGKLISMAEGAQKMVDTLNEGGLIHARVSKTTKGGHSVKIDGYTIENNKFLFEVKDPMNPTYNRFDPSRKQLCYWDNKELQYDTWRSLIRFQIGIPRK